MIDPISFGTWLRQKRRALDLTQKALADRAGCAEITVRRMEADEYKPSNALALVLFEKLGIPEAERTQWVRFARGLAEYPNHLSTSSPPREPKTNLPLPLTSFIGREKDIERIQHRLAETSPCDIDWRGRDWQNAFIPAGCKSIT
jgi:transcriptional regulator with XRE-family HTH domain